VFRNISLLTVTLHLMYSVAGVPSEAFLVRKCQKIWHPKNVIFLHMVFKTLGLS